MPAVPFPHSAGAAGAAPRRPGGPAQEGLLHGVQLFARALDAAENEPGWRERVRTRLCGLHRAFAEHVVVTEGPDGFYAELLDQAPRLARRIHVLLREHATVTDALSTLRVRVAAPETTVEELRGRGGELLRDLARHRQRGADLVHEAYATDIGGET